jgi:hypothetical protein
VRVLGPSFGFILSHHGSQTEIARIVPNRGRRRGPAILRVVRSLGGADRLVCERDRTT